MGIYFAGQEYDEIHIAGEEFSRVIFGGTEYHAPSAPDVVGTLTISVTRSGRNYAFAFSVTDPNGIRSITSATLTARDDTEANIMSDFVRSDANTFQGTDTRRNARWSRGTIAVTYVDATSGASHTLTRNWTPPT